MRAVGTEPSLGTVCLSTVLENICDPVLPDIVMALKATQNIGGGGGGHALEGGLGHAETATGPGPKPLNPAEA